MFHKRLTSKVFQVFGLAAMLGLFASTAQAVPVYLQAPTDASGNITMLTGESLSIDLMMDRASMPNSMVYYGFDANLSGGLDVQGVSGNGLYTASPFPLLNMDFEFMPVNPFAALEGPGSLPDVLLASFDLVASEVGSFTFDINGASIFLGEHLPALFQVGSEITINVVPEPGTWLLLATGLAGMVFWARRKRDNLVIA